MPGTWDVQNYDYIFCNDGKCTPINNNKQSGLNISVFGSQCSPKKISDQINNLRMSTSVSDKKDPSSGVLRFVDWIKNPVNYKFVYSTDDNMYNEIDNCIGGGEGHSGDTIKTTSNCPFGYENINGLTAFEQIKTSNDYYRICKRSQPSSAESCCKNKISDDQLQSCPDDIYNTNTNGRSLGCRAWMANYCQNDNLVNDSSCKTDFCDMSNTFNPCRDSIVKYCTPDNKIYGDYCQSVYSQTKDMTLKNSLKDLMMKYCQAPNRIVEDKNCRNFCNNDKFIQNTNTKATCDTLTQQYCSAHHNDAVVLDGAGLIANTYCSCAFPLADLSSYPGMTVECHEPTCNSVGYKTQTQIDNSTHCPSCLSVIHTGNISNTGGVVNVNQTMTCGSNGQVQQVQNPIAPSGYMNLQILSNKDQDGNQTLDSYTSISDAQSCVNKCANNINCKGVVYHPTDKTCWTLSDTSKTKDALGSMIYTIDKIPQVIEAKKVTIIDKSPTTQVDTTTDNSNYILWFILFIVVISVVFGVKYLFKSKPQSKHKHH